MKLIVEKEIIVNIKGVYNNYNWGFLIEVNDDMYKLKMRGGDIKEFTRDQLRIPRTGLQYLKENLPQSNGKENKIKREVNVLRTTSTRTKKVYVKSIYFKDGTIAMLNGNAYELLKQIGTGIRGQVIVRDISTLEFVLYNDVIKVDYMEDCK